MAGAKRMYQMMNQLDPQSETSSGKCYRSIIMGKVKTGSKLLAALGRTKKEQMKALMPPGVKGKREHPQVRGRVRLLTLEVR